MEKIELGSHTVGQGETPYVIAEIGANHNGDMDLARQMIDAAKGCGCHAVKFQSWTPDSLIAREEYDKNQVFTDSPKKHFGSLREMVKTYYLREDQHRELKQYCDKQGIDFCSTPFSPGEVDLLAELDVPFIKVASMDINNPDLLKYIADQQKPVLLSTGMATLAEIEKAVQVIEAQGNRRIILLHCIAIYPPAYEDIHLHNIPMLANTFGYPAGFSDHSIGASIPLAAAALGAYVIEKHFTMDKDMPGWDHDISADPQEMKTIVEEAEKVCTALGSYRRTVSEAEMEKRKKFRRSIVITRKLSAGHVLRDEDITFKRPGTCIAPDEKAYILGRKLARDLYEDDVLRWEDLV
ncbi:MAG: N-acetylneuraminate synthase family protein [Desulfobacteraceae bacterium]|nr:N-acetylneuraminate synthase family protein [Desulfobacteraceae bacterium]